MSYGNNAKTSSEIEHVEWSTGTGSGHNCANVRFGSGSSQASQSSGDICRICHCESDPHNPLLTPCYCSGSLKYVHQTCLQQWLTASDTNSCELCKFPFIMHTKIKPFNEWRSLDISGIERRRLCCSVLFHCAAALCVIWSLCVLIEKAADDVQRGLIYWPFWTKLAVVTVGLTGGIVFMYIQCKAYLHLCHRWKARNRILLIQNAPEKIHQLSSPSPVATKIARGKRVSEAHGGMANAASGTVEINASSNAPNLSTFSAAVGSNGGHVDVVSQISSFRPCPQGSGSMTPFHDSIHNVLENSETSSRGSVNDLCVGSRQDLSTGGISTDTGREHALQLSSFSGSGEHKAPSISSGVSNAVANGLGGFTYRPQTATKRYSNSSIFLENRDILNDSVVLGSDSSNVYEYSVQPKLEYGHPNMLTPAQAVANAASHDMRRYSDTKLQASGCEEEMYKAAASHDRTAADTKHVRQLLLRKPKQETVLDMELPISPLSPPTTYDGSYRNQQTQTLRRSFDTVDAYCTGNGPSSGGVPRPNVNASTATAADSQIDRSRLFFKSLPNLNKSIENLIRN